MQMLCQDVPVLITHVAIVIGLSLWIRQPRKGKGSSPVGRTSTIEEETPGGKHLQTNLLRWLSTELKHRHLHYGIPS